MARRTAHSLRTTVPAGLIGSGPRRGALAGRRGRLRLMPLNRPERILVGAAVFLAHFPSWRHPTEFFTLSDFVPGLSQLNTS